jgi:PAS domain S-box-containing protein
MDELQAALLGRASVALNGSRKAGTCAARRSGKDGRAKPGAPENRNPPARLGHPATAEAATLRCGAELHLDGCPANAAPVRTESDTLRMLRELEVHQIELEMQNAELRLARDELEAALKNYTDLYDLALVGYLSLDESGVVLEANLTGAALLGVERSRIINRRLPLFVSPKCRPIFLAFLKNVFTGAISQVCEAVILKADGGTFWADFRATPGIYLKGDRPWCQIVFGDITARKQSAQLTSREKEVLRLIAEGKPNKASAARLGISMRTIEKHRGHIMKKLDIHETAGLTRYAISAGISSSNARLPVV